MGTSSTYLMIFLLQSLLNYCSTRCQDTLAQDPANHGALFVPILLGSDKTTVFVMTGNTEYYPLYLSLGNVHNNVRRGQKNAVIPIAFLAIPKGIFFCFKALPY
jgi:hypothetical protein